MTSRVTRETIVFIIVAVLLVSSGFVVVLQLLGQSYSKDLTVLVVTGEGLQETYGFCNGNHTSDSYDYYRDKFWT